MQVLLKTGQLVTFKDVSRAKLESGILELIDVNGKLFAGFTVSEVAGWWSTKHDPRITTA